MGVGRDLRLRSFVFVGVFGLGHRLAAITGHRVLYRDGEPIALQEGKEVRFWVDFGTGERWELQKRRVARRLGRFAV